MTWTGQFEVTEVAEDGSKFIAVASVLPGGAEAPDKQEYGTLTQNTEHVKRLTLVAELEEGVETQIKVGDKMSAHGHFTS